jgi:TusA-related sulfurtransferase
MGSEVTFLDALTGRDFDRMAGCLAPEARAHLLLPRGAEDLVGRDPIAARIVGWFGGATEFEVLARDHDRVGDRHELRWRFRLVRDRDAAPQVIEQVAFVDIGEDGIVRLDLLCSGFQALSEARSGEEVEVFDAGDMGCGDGLAAAFRRRIAAVPVGASLVTVVGDPAAREDLPPLARMLGHGVTSVESQEDGRCRITVERRR